MASAGAPPTAPATSFTRSIPPTKRRKSPAASSAACATSTRRFSPANPDDIKSLEFQLRGMELWFIGSFSTGKAANKQAALVCTDEVEEHGKNILGDLDSRKKTSSGGIQINLSKPKLKNGPIHRIFNRGNQEEFFVPCPHCGHLQFLTFFPEEREVPFSEEFVWINTETGENFDHNPEDQFGNQETRKEEECTTVHTAKFIRLPKPLPLGEKRKLKTGRFVFEHCKNLLGKWDRLRVQTETYYECAACQGQIEDHHKRWMLDRGVLAPPRAQRRPAPSPSR
jgi:phage terminase large subunit GpA-like protein